MISQQYLFDLFDGQISRTAIRQVDAGDDFEVVGKFCRVAVDADETLDIWLCNTGNLRAGLGERKLTNLLAALDPAGATFRRLTGEAWGKTRGTGLVLANLDLLGIRRKRRVSPETAAAGAERLRQHARRASA